MSWFYYMENGTCVLGLGVLFGVGFFFVWKRGGKGNEMVWGPVQREKVGVEGVWCLSVSGYVRHLKKKEGGTFLFHAREREMHVQVLSKHLDALASALGELYRNDVWGSAAAGGRGDLYRCGTALAADLLPGGWSQPCSGGIPLWQHPAPVPAWSPQPAELKHLGEQGEALLDAAPG